MILISNKRKLTNKEKTVKGLLYFVDEELTKDSNNVRDLLDKFNNTKHKDFKAREKLAKKIFKKIGSNFKMNKPLYVDYGINITIGDNFYSNFDLVMLDVNEIIIGNNVMFGPRVSIYTATHPIDAESRNTYLEYGLKVVIKDNVWIGGNAVINPGVTIGKDSVIASGAVVVNDVPDNVIVGGNPARVIRRITDKDRENFEKMLEASNI